MTDYMDLALKWWFTSLDRSIWKIPCQTFRTVKSQLSLRHRKHVINAYFAEIYQKQSLKQRQLLFGPFKS